MSNNSGQENFSNGLAWIAAIGGFLWCLSETNEFGTALFAGFIFGIIGYVVGRIVWVMVVLALVVGWFLIRQAACYSVREAVKTEIVQHDKNSRKIYIQNTCQENLDFALYFKNANNKWVAKYWYDIDGSEATYLSSSGRNLKTNDNTIYYYARSRNYEWKGRDYYRLGGNKYGFRKYNMSLDQDGDYTISLNCDS